MAGAIPFGFDRADGETTYPDGGSNAQLGTATPEGVILVQNTDGTSTLDEVPFQESPESPEIERAEQATFTHRFVGSWDDIVNRLQVLGRRTLERDSYDNWYRVLSSQVRRVKPGLGELTVTSEAISFDTPPDDFSMEPVELGLNIMKHPRYFWAFLGDGYGSETEQQNQMVIRLLQDYFENTTAVYRDALVNMLENSKGDDDGDGAQPPRRNFNAKKWEQVFASGKVSGTDEAKAAAQEIIMKYWRGEEQPYVVGWQITWSRYFWKPPLINPGGYLEDPILDGQLPSYFWSPVAPWEEPNTDETIFSDIIFQNPQCYSDDGTWTGELAISWLRKADRLEYQRTWFKLTSTWIGSPVGQWDVDLYNQNNGPQTAADYREIRTNYTPA